MNRVKMIKAAQIAEAAKKGEENPYLNPKGKKTQVSNKPLNRLQQVKQHQLDEAEKTGINPYEKQSAVESAVKDDDINNLSHYQAAMEVDLTKVANQKDLLEKAKVKQSVLPTYLPFVDDYVASGNNYPNDVAVQCMIWLLDIAEIEHGLNLALHLVKQGQKMPKRFNRDMPTFLCDMFYDLANALLKEEQGASPYLDTLVIIAEQDKWEVHPLCMSKLYSMLAKHKVRTEDYQQAFDLCIKAEEVNPEKAGVKGLKAEIEKYLQSAKEEYNQEQPINPKG